MRGGGAGARAPAGRCSATQRPREPRVMGGPGSGICDLSPSRPADYRPREMSTVTDSRSVLAGAAHALLDERRLLDLDELGALAALPPESVPSLAALAHEVRL